MQYLTAVFCVFLLFAAVSSAKQDNGGLTPGIEEAQSEDGPDSFDDGPGQDAGGKDVDAVGGLPETPEDSGTAGTETYYSGDRALLSGVPVYHQQNISSPWICSGHDIKTGCGPVAAASIAAWWERRGFTSMMAGSQNSLGIPEDTIVELAQLQYVGILPNCTGANTATLPDAFKTGLEDYLEDHSGVGWDVTRHKIREDSDTGQLWDMVKNEIDSGRPMVYLYRPDGAKEPDGYLFSTHYGVIVGYDSWNGRKNLILQTNWGEGNWTYPYMNTYASDSSLEDNSLVTLGHYARPAAAINFNIYTIVPESEPDYEGQCSGWLMPGNEFHYKDPHDGVQSHSFWPRHYLLRDSETWGPTDSLSYQDGECFVAHWVDSDDDGWYDGADNCPETANPCQTDTDGDGTGDECDYPDIALYMEYETPYTMTNISGGIRLGFDINSTICNMGTEAIPAGTGLRLSWSQEVVSMGGGEEEGDYVLKIDAVSARNNTTKLVYNMFSNESRVPEVAAIPYSPFSHESRTITLPADFHPNTSITVSNAQFYTVVNSTEDCVLVTHTGNVDDDLEKELDEDNTVVLEGYDTLTYCYGITEVELGDLEMGRKPGYGFDQGLQHDIAEAGLAKVIDIIRDVGPEGALIDVGPVVLDFPRDAVEGPVGVQVTKVKQFTGISPATDVYDISARGAFGSPVTITFSYDESSLEKPESSLGIFRLEKGGWKMLPSTVDTAANTVSAGVTHFSLYTVAPGFSPDRFIGKGETFKSMKNETWEGKKAYRIVKRKKARLLGLIEVEMEIETVVDAEKEEQVQETKPWWAFLALE
ncbi:hypothetical protein GF318_04945 [Candidatus Micrarchaeota archaeon]|nr:hypothetical protein [Candidatus Micrarchaeota archaeon]